MIFDLYFLPVSVSEMGAKDTDLAKATVEAENAFMAGTSPEAMHLVKQGFYVCDTVAHGTLSRVVMGVRSRARIALEDADRPPGFEDANSAQRRRGVPFFPR